MKMSSKITFGLEREPISICSICQDSVIRIKVEIAKYIPLVMAEVAVY